MLGINDMTIALCEGIVPWSILSIWLDKSKLELTFTGPERNNKVDGRPLALGGRKRMIVLHL